MEQALWMHWARKDQKVMCLNVSWGMFNHECDILVLNKDNTFTEVDSIVLFSYHEDSKIIGFSKCSTTNEYIYKDGVATLCGCDSCNQFKKTLDIYTKKQEGATPNTI